jgi:hypothetical protein
MGELLAALAFSLVLGAHVLALLAMPSRECGELADGNA